MRHTLGDIIKPREWIFDSRLVRDGDDMEQSVGGTAHRDIERDGVVDGFSSDDVTKADAAAEQLEHLTRGGARQLVSLGRNGENGPVTGQCDPERLAQTVHG